MLGLVSTLLSQAYFMPSRLVHTTLRTSVSVQSYLMLQEPIFIFSIIFRLECRNLDRLVVKRD